MRLSKIKTLVSPDCSVLFQALYFCLTLTGELLPHNSTKNHLIFKRFKLLVSFLLSFLATIKLFINYSPWILKAFHPQMVWAVPLNQPVLANVASSTSSLSALYSLPLLSRHPSVRVCPLATAISSAAQAGTRATDSQGIYCFLSKAKPNLPTSHLTRDSYFPLHPASVGKGLPETPPWKRGGGTGCSVLGRRLSSPPLLPAGTPSPKWTKPTPPPLPPACRKRFCCQWGPACTWNDCRGWSSVGDLVGKINKCQSQEAWSETERKWEAVSSGVKVGEQPWDDSCAVQMVRGICGMLVWQQSWAWGDSALLAQPRIPVQLT